VVVEPYQQGELDGLCGLYAIINAVNYCLRQSAALSEDDSQKLFDFLLRRLHDDDLLQRVFSTGIGTRMMARLLDDARSWLEDHKGVYLYCTRPSGHGSRHSVRQKLEVVSAHLHQRHTSVIIRAKGREDHWTVVRQINDKSILLFDSDGFQRFGRKSIEVKKVPGKRRSLYLAPAAFFLLEAVNGKGLNIR